MNEFLLVLQRVFCKIYPFLILEAVHHSRLMFLCSLPQFKLEEFIELTRQNKAQLLAEGVVEIFACGIQLLKVCALAMVANSTLAEICILHLCLTGRQSRIHILQATEERFVIPTPTLQVNIFPSFSFIYYICYVGENVCAKLHF